MASILETFYILFETNAAQVKKGEAEAGAATKTFEADVVSAEAAAVAMGEHVAHVFENVAIRIASAFAIERVVEFLGNLSEVNAELGVTAERLGISVEDLDAWGQATQRAGGSVDGFTQTLDFLNRGMADIATKGTSRLKPFFDELKIRVTDAPGHVRPLLAILGDLSDRLSKLGAQQRAGIAEKLGIDQGTLLLLVQGRRGVDELVERQKQLGVATEKDAEIAHKYRQALEDLEQRMRHAGTTIGSELLPKLAEFFKWIGTVSDYLAGHKGLVEGFFIGVGGVIATVYFPAVVEAAAATWALLSPLLLVVAPIAAVGAAIALLVDDVQNFLAGNKSVIGELSKTWPAVGETVREVVKDLGAAFEWFWSLLTGGWELASAILRRVATVASDVGKSVGGFIHELTAGLANAFPFWTKVLGGLVELLEEVAKVVAGAVGWFLKLGASAVVALPKALHNFATEIDGKPHSYAYGAPAAAFTGGRGPAGRQVEVLRPTPRPDGPQPGHTMPKGSEVAALIVKAQGAIRTADSTPISSINNSAVNQRAGDRQVEVNVTGPITIQTQGPADADGIAKDIAGHLKSHIRQAIEHHDDGVQS